MQHEVTLDNATPETYHEVSFDASYLCGPCFPEQAFATDVKTMNRWYEAVVECWERDCYQQCEDQLFFHFSYGSVRIGHHHFFEEAFKTGLRRIEDSLLSNLSDLRVANRHELLDFCRLFRAVCEHDATKVQDRCAIDIKIDEHLAQALGATNITAFGDEIGKVISFGPDEYGIIALWTAMAGYNDSSLLPETEARSCTPPRPESILQYIVPNIWRLWWQLGAVSVPEPTCIGALSDVRSALDEVASWCERDEHGGNAAEAKVDRCKKRTRRRRGRKAKPWSERKKQLELVETWERLKDETTGRVAYSQLSLQLENWMPDKEIEKQIAGYYKWERRLYWVLMAQKSQQKKDDLAEIKAPGMSINDLNHVLRRVQKQAYQAAR